MIIQATPYGTKKEEPFAFTYSGDFTDERVDGIGDVTLNTSGQLVTTGQTVRVTVYILGAGGGGAYKAGRNYHYIASGGGGGFQTIEVELAPGTYEIVIGTGGAGAYESSTAASAPAAKAGSGGNTTAFGYTSTGGKGGVGNAPGADSSPGKAGNGGTPNGGAGNYYYGGTYTAQAGGNPNGGAGTNVSANGNKGGNGLVRITFS